MKNIFFILVLIAFFGGSSITFSQTDSTKTNSNNMKKVTGIGGIFFKCKDPAAIKKWYSEHLGLNTNDYGATFEWVDEKGEKAQTQWSPFKETTKYFEPSQKDFMINYRVENLESLIEELKKEGVEIAGEIQKTDYGNFGWIVDPEGNKIELWEPPVEKK